jgi:hypothetical protein
MASEYIGELKKWVAEASRLNGTGESTDWTRAIELISKSFAVKNHEVAIMGLTPDERSLRFIVPQTLRAVGQVPLSSTKSLAARTVREKRPDLVNHFTAVPHASVFEAVPIAEDQRTDAIQKIMSSPIIQNGKVIGVVQVSRKGSNVAEAGADFTYPQLRELKTISDTLAPCVLLHSKD